MKTKALVFKEFSEMGFRVAFETVSGLHFEGYILDIRGETFSFGLGGPLAPEEPRWFDMEDVDFSSLSFYSEDARKYMDARWDEASGSWKILPSVPAQEQPHKQDGKPPKRVTRWRLW
ncbi:MAG: hypothetical protein HYU64_19675 [Armatimonadetes bacterium]|nr:hypothetical protein [Armatimonadota bacterium]